MQICALLLFATISVVKTEPIPKMAPPGPDCNGCHCCNGSCAGYCNGCVGNFKYPWGLGLNLCSNFFELLNLLC